MAGRPRRTRIYGANYNIGESYYKRTLDDLDRKQNVGLNLDSDPIGLSKPSRNIDDILKGSSILKGLHDEEPTIFDYSPKEFSPRESLRKSLPIFDDEPEEEIRSSLRRMGEIKKRASPGYFDDFTALKENTRKNSLESSRFSKLKSYDLDDFNDDLSTAKADIFKSTSTATSASSRANATKERLANIEFEMSERFEKQVQRDKRSANLKKILSETGVETSTKVAKKVTF